MIDFIEKCLNEQQREVLASLIENGDGGDLIFLASVLNNHLRKQGTVGEAFAFLDRMEFPEAFNEELSQAPECMPSLVQIAANLCMAFDKDVPVADAVGLFRAHQRGVELAYNAEAYLSTDEVRKLLLKRIAKA